MEKMCDYCDANPAVAVRTWWSSWYSMEYDNKFCSAQCEDAFYREQALTDADQD